MKKLSLFASLFLVLPLAILGGGKIMVITWGASSPEWSRLLGVSAIRLGCSDSPPSCAQEAEHMAREQHVSSVLLAILLKPANVVQNASAFAQLGSSHPEIAEIGFDDFVGQADKAGLTGEALSSLLGDFSTCLHSSGSRLKWGITLYQDELWNGRLARLGLSEETRRAVDAVHLFPHYRKEQVPLEKSVSEAKRLFPSAGIILGSYAYDRREYLPCSPHGARCTDEEEISLFNQNLHQSLDLVRRGIAAGIEFYPGNFGQETSWKNWDNPRFCKQGEQSECIENTLAMRQQLRAVFGAGTN